MGNLSLETIDGNQANNYVDSNTADDQLDLAMTDDESITVTVANIDLTTGDAQAPASQLYKALRNIFFILTGAMTGARSIIVPNNKKLYIFTHECTGGFTATVKTAAGTGIGLVNGETKILYCDGTNVRFVK